MRINEQIKAPTVRLLGSENEQLGVLAIAEALRTAEEQGLDLVEIASNAEPPVCRVMDYGKYVFEQRKKQAVAKKKQKQIQVKEIKFRPSTEEADYQVKLRNIKRFLGQGNKVKVTIRFRGRELRHQELGLVLLTRVTTDVLDVGIVEQEVKREGRHLLLVLAPKTQKH